MNPRRDILGPDRALKSAFRDLVLNRIGGIDAAAVTAGVLVGRSQIGSWLNPHEDAFPRVDVVVALEVAAGAPVVTAEMARRSGHALIPVTADGDGRLAEDMAAFGRGAAELFASYADAMADGRVTVTELQQLASRLGEVMRVTHGALAEVEHQIRGRAE